MKVEGVVDFQPSEERHSHLRTHARHRAHAVSLRRSERQKLFRIARSIHELVVVLSGGGRGASRPSACGSCACNACSFDPPVVRRNRDMGPKIGGPFSNPYPIRTAFRQPQPGCKRVGPVHSPADAQALLEWGEAMKLNDNTITSAVSRAMRELSDESGYAD